MCFIFFFNDTATTEIYTLSLHDALPIFVWVGKDLDLPIKVLTDKTEETGIDRVLNVAAAYEQMGKPCVVVDEGTAATVDCCNEEGEFVGGAIVLGASMMLHGLHEHTARLPQTGRAS